MAALKLFKCSTIDDDKKNHKNNGSTHGKSYVLPKVHKRRDSDVPLRLISSTIGTHNYNLSKFLVTSLAGVSRSVYTIKDSFSFASEISKSRNNNFFMASFDVTSLFIDIPVNETINIILDRLFGTCDQYQGFTKKQFREMLNICTMGD